MSCARSRLTTWAATALTGVILYCWHSYTRLSGDGTPDLFGHLRVWAGMRDSPPDQPLYGAVVAAGRSDTDLSWMNDTAFKDSWDVYIYNVDEPVNVDPRLRIPENKGHEAMVYLTYIIENYGSLPWMIVFVHGHLEAWHQEKSADLLINTLKRKALAREGYISLRCDWYPSCPAEIRPHAQDAIMWGPGVKRKETELAIVGNWRLLFSREVMPETIASPCCAQFAVSRKAIQQRPRSDYERMREWLLATPIEDNVSGRVFEKLWAYIFTGKAVQ